jgi:hypothetical protein
MFQRSSGKHRRPGGVPLGGVAGGKRRDERGDEQHAQPHRGGAAHRRPDRATAALPRTADHVRSAPRRGLTWTSSRAVAVICGLLGLVGTTVLAGVSQAHTTEPPTPGFTRPPEAYATYEAESTCSPTEKPGTVALRDQVLKSHYPGSASDYGITRSCTSSNSGHDEGRALDWMMSIRITHEKQHADSFLNWLLETDAAGNKHANARRLGVMYLIYNNKMWRAYRPADGWQEYHGCLSKPATSQDTYCHRDHIHVSLSWAGANKQTTFWTARA